MDDRKRKNNKPLLAIDLFCGCGGLTLGLKKAGFKIVCAVDNNPLAVETYEANHPRVKIWSEDITKLHPKEIKKELGLRKGRLDLLAGCPPCQGFSSLRTLNGSRDVNDPRNDLLWDFYYFVEEFMPKTIMFENVPGLAKDVEFKVFLSRMQKLGYKGEPRVLNAAEYGVPQRRRRLIYLAGRKKPIPFADPKKRKRKVRHAIGKLPPAGRSGDPVHDIPENRTPAVMELIQRIPKDGGSRRDLPEKYQLECHKRCNGFKDVYGRMAWDEVAPTITSGCFNPSKGRFLHPEENRAITLREAALLQGFPKRYKFPNLNSKSDVALLIGNALPPPFIKAHADSIKDSL
ncbi:DNA cytosine methyltransferase [Candidatus Pacearchaeota archaeon]|nr:DNA cytosine methyltransferase [Candidatus Pacearchaeota archaeon]